MSDALEKDKNSSRRYNDEVAIKRQLKIAKQHNFGFNDLIVKQPHRLAKHHALDCGNPGCHMCGNPRKIHKELTPQEHRLYQDTDLMRDRKSNGLPPNQDIEQID